MHTWWEQQFRDIFGKKDAWRMILGDNPAGHCFVLRNLVLIELFQISHDCVTKYRLKTYLKAIRDTFFPNVWNFPIRDIFIQQKGKV